MLLQNKIVPLLFLAILTGCGRPDTVSPGEYVSYFNSDKVVQTIKSGNVEYEVKYITPEYIALKDGRNSSGGVDRALVNKRLNDIKSNLYFYIKIPQSNTSVHDESAKMAMLDYYNYGIKNSMTLSVGKTASLIKPEYVHFEDNYGLAPANTIIACFSVESLATHNDLVLSFDDVPNNNPDLRFSYPHSLIAQIPALSL